MKIGNWDTTEEAIKWDGSDESFEFSTTDMLATQEVADRNVRLYKWILEATAKDWLDEDDLYDLNFAFVYAAGAAGEPLDYATLDSTVEYQFEILGDGDEDDEDEY